MVVTYNGECLMEVVYSISCFYIKITINELILRECNCSVIAFPNLACHRICTDITLCCV